MFLCTQLLPVKPWVLETLFGVTLENFRAITNTLNTNNDHPQMLKQGIRRLSPLPAVRGELKKFTKSKGFTRKPKTAYSRQHAAYLLSKITGKPVEMTTLGPTSNDDIHFIPLVRDQASILYTILGTSENQLQDSVIVDRTVKSFLERDQVEKAIMMCRLAKDQGSVAMNRVNVWMFDHGKVNESIELINQRKKYLVSPTEATLTTLFDGCANSAKLSLLQVKKLERILLGWKDPLNYSHIHSAFQAMLNCDDKSVALDLFNRWKEEPVLAKFKPTVQLFTILMEGFADGSSKLEDIEVFTNVELIWERVLQVPEEKRDPELYESFIRAYLNVNRIDLVARGLEATSKYFYIDTAPPKILATKTRFRDVETKLDLPSLKPSKRKYYASPRLVDILMKTYITLGDYQQASNIFDQFAASGSVHDLGLWNRKIICTTYLNKSEAGEKCVEIYDSLGSKVRPNGTTRWLVFNAIYTQSLTTMNDKGLFVIGSAAEKLYNLSTDFMERFREKATAQELDGYLKSLKRLRLTTDERQHVLDLIGEKKPGFKKELNSVKDKRKHREYIESVIKSEKIIEEKQAMKRALND